MLADKERTIHTLLRRHPELIDEGLKDRRPEYELIRDDKRLDLVFRIRDRAIVVEIKRTVLAIADVEQVVGYCDKIRTESNLAKQHFLIGKRPQDVRRLEKYISTQRYKVVPKYLFFDIPTELIWDILENKYVAARDDCFNNPRYQNYIKLRV